MPRRSLLLVQPKVIETGRTMGRYEDSRMRIFLVDPPMQSIMLARAEWFPMGLTYLAGTIVREGHEVLIYNGEHDPSLDYVNNMTLSSNYYRYLDALKDHNHPAWKKLAAVMAEFKPDVVGITAYSVKFPSAKRIAAIAKDYNSKIPVVVGGQHATIMTDEVLSDPNIDFVIKGEGELAFTEFLRQLASFRQWETVESLSFKKGHRFIHNSLRPLVENIDDLAFPARHCLHDLEHYNSSAMANLFASRGCPYQCTYCGTQNIWTRSLRQHSPERVIEEIRSVKDEYGSTFFTFHDDVFGLNKKCALELTKKMAKAKLGVTWSCLMKTNTVSEELIINMRKAGCTKIDMGVESGSDKVLKDVKKGSNSEKILWGGRMIKKHGFFLYAFLMIGLPTETEEDIKQTKEFLYKLKPHWAGLSIFTPIPGTAIYKELQEKNHIPDNPDFERFSYQSPHSNFAISMKNRQAFPEIAQEMQTFVQAYNTSFRNLLMRFLSRGYHRNMRLLFFDLKRFMTWRRVRSAHIEGEAETNISN